MRHLLSKHRFILSEAAICERLRRMDGVELHPTLFDAPLIYGEKSSKVLAGIYKQYIEIAREYQVPILIAAPTWRLDAERVSSADVPENINQDAVEFIRAIDDYDAIYYAGLLAPKNDCYDPDASLSVAEAEAFHAFQANQLGDMALDCLIGQTMPAIAEAEGMARAMLSTGTPSVISFCINRHGQVLDGTPLSEAIDYLDDRLGGELLGYKVNCSHPSFVHPEKMQPRALSRLIGINANASSLDHGELELLGKTVEDDLEKWIEVMVNLNQNHGVKILGGCCGTTDVYLRGICEKMVR